MSRECSLCLVGQGLEQFRGRSRRCMQCKTVTDRIHRRADSQGYRQAYRATAIDDVRLRHLMGAFEDDPAFSFREYFGDNISDAAIAAHNGSRRPLPVVRNGVAASGVRRDGVSVSGARRDGVAGVSASGAPPPPPPGTPPVSTSTPEAFGPVRVHFTIESLGPFSVSISVWRGR